MIIPAINLLISFEIPACECNCKFGNTAQKQVFVLVGTQDMAFNLLSDPITQAISDAVFPSKFCSNTVLF